jgi:hypothetical protein
MQKWLAPALAYIPRWMDFQMRMSEQPGCVIAIAHKNRIVLEQAFGHADLARGIRLTPGHRFRVASHSKSYTAAGVLKARQAQARRRGRTLRQGPQSAGCPPHARPDPLPQRRHRPRRQGGRQFLDRRPFLNAEELMADLEAAPAIEPNTRFKYSNHGFGLIGLAIEAVTGWIECGSAGPHPQTTHDYVRFGSSVRQAPTLAHFTPARGLPRQDQELYQL